MKTNARVVVVGGGMMGASLLYHLALEGCTDTLLIEKGELTSGSTWHAAGQCPSITGSFNLAKIHAYSNQLYPKLEALTGQYVSWHACGGLRLATNERELDWLKYVHGYSKSIGFRMEIVGLDEIKRLNPFLTTDNVIAAAWTTDDGHGDPSGLCNALAKAARDLGATVMRHNRVIDIRRRPSGEWEVITEKGSVLAEMVVNAAGCYARQVAAMVGADAPITNMQHHYVVTHPIPAFMERNEEIPVMRDSYTSGYFRQEQKSGLMGIYESTGLQEAWAPRGFPEWEASNELFPDDLERIAPWLERAIERMPIFGEVGIRRVINGAIPHTSDGAPLLGPAANLRNFWMCCGTSFGIAQGGGCGKYLAQWMLHGDAEINMAEFDPRRFGEFADAAYVRDKVFLDYRSTFTTRAPGEEEMAGRPRKTSPLHGKLLAHGCVHTETFGWERPKWFSLDGRVEEYGYRRNNVFEVVRDEVAAVHDRVGVLDLTGFAKYDIRGSGAEAFLNRVCANQVPRKIGGIALVHLLSPGGRIQGEMTVTRLEHDRFYALSAAAAELRDQDLLTQSVAAGEQVLIENVTEDRGVLVLSGPRSRDILSLLTDADLGNDAFRWLQAREIDIAGHRVRALRVSYVGELGWELHPRIEALPALYDAVWEAGRQFGIANYGLYAVNSMRIEKGYKAWSSELTNELNMLEADMSRFINFGKPDFVGKAATLEQGLRPLKIVYAEVAATDADARGGEPVLVQDRCVGVVTSGAYGHRVRKSLAFACIAPEFAAPGNGFDVLVQGERRAATVLGAAAFDPDNSRMRG
ncbi:MAG TPA: FAD-dependent oxidoreductase [Steroidobacteraceae bacterium]|jgi:dimethylglycine dehydrogenase|nr:FAD-dependent oxidoreductase [Steroidobacteraceae bacterium]